MMSATTAYAIIAGTGWGCAIAFLLAWRRERNTLRALAKQLQWPEPAAHPARESVAAQLLPRSWRGIYRGSHE